MQRESEPDLVTSRCNLTLGPCMVATVSQHAIFLKTGRKVPGGDCGGSYLTGAMSKTL